MYNCFYEVVSQCHELALYHAGRTECKYFSISSHSFCSNLLFLQFVEADVCILSLFLDTILPK